MRTTISKRFVFEAAHRLEQHDGKCRNLHGHSYHVEIGVEGEPSSISGSSLGMVVDFSDLGDAFKEHIYEVCDHAYLQGTREQEPPPSGKRAVLPIPVTTAEHLAAWIYTTLAEVLYPIPVAFVRVYETETSCAEVRG